MSRRMITITATATPIVSSNLTLVLRFEEVVEEDETGRRHKKCADGGKHVEDFPALAGVVRVDAARHAEHTREVHREEREIEREQCEPEVPVPQ